ncbi:MAG: GGDEF domain-containing protein [Oscillospiraceae bacterium]|nr:GGDEF domain-containing protein [Oscillospiraceae bacterium]
MATLDETKSDGISLKSTHWLMMAVSIVLAAVLLCETFLASYYFKQLSSATDAYISLQQDAAQLMSASDYLTDEVQTFTVTRDRMHMDKYFEEADVTQRREKALDAMREAVGDTEAMQRLDQAMTNSVELMDREYYAMALMVSALHIQDCPAVISGIELLPEDADLEEDDKIRMAQGMVHDEIYYGCKQDIRREIENCISELETTTHSVQENSGSMMNGRLRFVRILVIAQTIAMITVLVMTSYLGINPILKGVERIKQDSKLPIIGSHEFRYLARNYNKMYEAFQNSIAQMDFEATHDKLTGLYNKDGYEVLRESIDLESSAVLKMDAAYLKDIGDVYGIDQREKATQKLAEALKGTFRSEDYICRIGEYDFVVFMIHVSPKLRDLIENKVEHINDLLADTTDGVQELSVCAGVAFGSGVDACDEVVARADKALKQAKDSGSYSCLFYEPENQDE